MNPYANRVGRWKKGRRNGKGNILISQVRSFFFFFPFTFKLNSFTPLTQLTRIELPSLLLFFAELDSNGI